MRFTTQRNPFFFCCAVHFITLRASNNPPSGTALMHLSAQNDRRKISAVPKSARADLPALLLAEFPRFKIERRILCFYQCLGQLFMGISLCVWHLLILSQIP
jgi:hypothetical protein